MLYCLYLETNHVTLFMSVGLSPLAESYCSFVGVYSVGKNKFNSTVCYAYVYLSTKEKLFSKIRRIHAAEKTFVCRYYRIF